MSWKYSKFLRRDSACSLKTMATHDIHDNVNTFLLRVTADNTEMTPHSSTQDIMVDVTTRVVTFKLLVPSLAFQKNTMLSCLPYESVNNYWSWINTTYPPLRPLVFREGLGLSGVAGVARSVYRMIGLYMNSRLYQLIISLPTSFRLSEMRAIRCCPAQSQKKSVIWKINAWWSRCNAN